MDLSLRQRLFAEYPIPESLSIFGGDMVSTFPIVDLNTLIQTCVEELRSDLYIVDYITSYSMTTFLPEDAIGVVSAQLNFPFQGNRSVKVQFNPVTKQAYCRYPNVYITYRRRLSMANIHKLNGDRLIYVKHYILSKMADKEYTVLTTVQLSADNGQMNMEALKAFSDKHLQAYQDMKQDILLYTVGS